MNLLHLIVIVVLTIAGYASHGLLNLGPKKVTTETSGDKPEATDPTEVEEKDQSTAKLEDASYHISKVITEDFPSEITMLKDGQGLVNNRIFDIYKGDRLKPLSISGDNLKVKIVKNGIEAEVAVSLTDFESLVTPVTQRRLLGFEKQPTVTDNTPVDPQPEVLPFDEPEVTPRPVTPKKPDLPKIAKGDHISDSQIKSLMGKSYKNVSILASNKIISAEVGPLEMVSDKEYQTGIITFKRDTLLGIRELKAKALIFDGEVEKWVWAKSNQEIR